MAPGPSLSLFSIDDRFCTETAVRNGGPAHVPCTVFEASPLSCIVVNLTLLVLAEALDLARLATRDRNKL